MCQIRWTFAFGLIVTVALAIFGNSSVAWAQECVGGRVRVSGRCCWPGQQWSDSTRTCVGVPQCPDGRVEEGESCVLEPQASSTSVRSSPRTSSSSSNPQRLAPLVVTQDSASQDSSNTDEGVRLWADSVEGWPSIPRGTRPGAIYPERRSPIRKPLLIVGAILYEVGYAAAIVTQAALNTSCNGYYYYYRPYYCEVWPLAFIPVVGTMITSYGVYGIPSFVLQSVGLGTFLGGLWSEFSVRTRARGAGLRLALMPAVGADLGGLSLFGSW
jgi:hypothetical protein